MQKQNYQDIINSGEIFLAPRDGNFKSFIHSLLIRGNLKEEYTELFLQDDCMEIYSQAFTSSTADGRNNYEVFEQLGDISINKFIVWYSYRRFPQLFCPEGVEIVSKIRIKYGSKESFQDIAESLGFWPYISATENQRQSQKKILLEDTFESFIGATEYLVDREIRRNVGYSVVYDILNSVFSDIPISLRYEDLVDNITKLKELFDSQETRKAYGKFKYFDGEMPNSSLKWVEAWTIDHKGNKITKLGEDRDRGVGALLATAKQQAAGLALVFLRKRGYVKIPPRIYQSFCT
jgi:dsRNA-specific ribonuclease